MFPTKLPLLFACLVLVHAFGAAPPARAQSAEEVFHDIRARWESEDRQGIARYFDESVEIRLGRQAGRAGRDQATQWLGEYFDSVEVLRFSIPKDGMGATSCVYEQEFSDSEGKRRRNRIYVSLIRDGQRLRITSLRE